MPNKRGLASHPCGHQTPVAGADRTVDFVCEACRSERTLLDLSCRMCAPFDCEDPDRHLGVPSRYTPLKNRGCHCGADFDGRDCMCFEGGY